VCLVVLLKGSEDVVFFLLLYTSGTMCPRTVGNMTLGDPSKNSKKTLFDPFKAAILAQAVHTLFRREN